MWHIGRQFPSSYSFEILQSPMARLVESPACLCRYSPARQTTTWTKVYETWRDLLNVIIRGYNSHGFEAWTIPILYVSGKHLRDFAIKADVERNNNSSLENAAEPNFQDDFDPEEEQNKMLEDCARQLNRVFNLCLSDRYASLGSLVNDKLMST